MRVREMDTGCRQAIEIRRPDARRAVTTEIAEADIVGIDENDVRQASALRAAVSQGERRYATDSKEVPASHLASGVAYITCSRVPQSEERYVHRNLTRSYLTDQNALNRFSR